jgi:hypothetical protein
MKMERGPGCRQACDIPHRAASCGERRDQNVTQRVTSLWVENQNGQPKVDQPLAEKLQYDFHSLKKVCLPT